MSSSSDIAEEGMTAYYAASKRGDKKAAAEAVDSMSTRMARHVEESEPECFRRLERLLTAAGNNRPRCTL